ncbi:O-antigen ligase family protein [Algoriphagus persicinus]|uniref:O-antigen ligase family protein n=1 Tax=Algoriphagus persicinus TaxID=3108754 RepID=UPI002B39DCD3|nr:O-antigen ligase family protein [Algoriphagus sp. E1-3-M2]MEB2786970.1 O-antigen ligase family protein [Algoriphagus sp. E1-3-M2]
MSEARKGNLYKIERNLLLAAFALTGFGHYFRRISLPLEYSTFLIFVVLVLQIISGTFRFPKFLFYIISFIIIQTFIINPSNLSDPRVGSHFIGLILLALSLFSFVSYYRNNLYDFAINYYKLVYYISLFSIFQIAIFLLFGISIIPQNFITGQLPTGSPVFIPEVLGILPRNLGLSSEPANFSYILIPGVYLAISQLFTKELFVANPKRYAWIILIAMVLTFSLVAYFGILLSALFLLKEKIFKLSVRIIYPITLLLVLIYGIYASGVGEKFISLVKMGNEVSDNRMETHSYTAFALISNVMVVIESQKENHFIGSGLNTHLYNYDKYIYTIFEHEQVSLELNKEGAGSIFLRTLSEFGIPGLLALFIFFIRFKLKRGVNFSKYQIINEMALVTILLFCTRSGHYTNITFLIFGAIYYFSYQVNKTQSSRLVNKEIPPSNYSLLYPEPYVKW